MSSIPYQRISGSGTVAASFTYINNSGALTGPLTALNGTAALPSYAFISSPSTGMYSPAVNQLGLSTNGVAALTFDASQNATFTGTLGNTGSTSVVKNISSPGNLLQISGPAFPGFLVGATGLTTGVTFQYAGTVGGNAYAQISAGNLNTVAGLGVQFLYANTIGSFTGNATAITLDSSGNATFTQTIKVQSAAVIRSGSLTPNTNVTGSVGDIYMWTGGGAGTTFWVKESGTATNSGWVGK